jgi:hypothetical protein
MAISRKPQPWSPADATESIRTIARGNFRLIRKKHAIDRLQERGLFIGDALYVLKNGFVFEEAQSSSREGCFKYCMECSTPNSNQRSLKVVTIPGLVPPQLKIITVMWVDE